MLVHKRFVPASNSFQFKHCMLMLDAKLMRSKNRMSWIIGINQPGILSVNNTNFIDKKDKPIDEKIFRLLGRNFTLNEENQLFLLTTPSVFGYTFNPASFYFITDKNMKISECFVEVHNTFNESHIYQLESPITDRNDTVEFHHDKKFHVSPFIGREGNYRFEFKLSDSRVKLQIDLIQKDKLLLSTCYLGDFVLLTKFNVVKNIHNIIATVFLTEGRILREAYRLHFQKKMRFFKKPKPLPGTLKAVSRGFISKLRIPFV